MFTFGGIFNEQVNDSVSDVITLSISLLTGTSEPVKLIFFCNFCLSIFFNFFRFKTP